MSTPGYPASQIRHREMSMALARDIMSKCSELERAERIATHYARMSATAIHLCEIMKFVRYGREVTDDVRSCIQYLARELREHHAMDLGIELRWGDPNQLPRDDSSSPRGLQPVRKGAANVE